MAQFFIHRPVFAWVLAIVTMLAGAWGVLQLPISQYPDIAPTTVRISASYPGATAEAVQNSVTTPIEDTLTGIQGLIYFESTSTQGRSSLTLTFDDSVEPTDALNDVQSKVSSVESRLPTAVRSSGVSVTRSTSSILMVGALVSTDGKYSTVELGNLLEEVVEGPVKRVTGVGGINVFGSGYAMRIWLDPLRLAQFQLRRVLPEQVTGDLQEGAGVALPHIRDGVVDDDLPFRVQLHLGDRRIAHLAAVARGVEHRRQAHAAPGVRRRMRRPRRGWRSGKQKARGRPRAFCRIAGAMDQARPACFITSAAKSSSFFSMPSPTARRVNFSTSAPALRSTASTVALVSST